MEDGLVKSSDGSEFRKDLNMALFSMLYVSIQGDPLHGGGCNLHSNCAGVGEAPRWTEDKQTYRYSAACDVLVCSSSTASGARAGGLLAAEAAPRSGK